MPGPAVYSVRFGAADDQPTEVGDFRADLLMTFNDGFFADPGDDDFELAYYLLNATERGSRRWPVRRRALGKNLTGVSYDGAVNVLSPVGYLGNPGPPRICGVRLGVHF